jgi:hypothetical protein
MRILDSLMRVREANQSNQGGFGVEVADRSNNSRGPSVL